MNRAQERKMKALEKKGYYLLREHKDRIVMARKRRPFCGFLSQRKFDYKGILVNGTILNMVPKNNKRLQ